ncbi:MAG TPA: molybdopterin cofactor-binding domain-containing protein, partial [Armatimonadota bacterium]|nr:molybdopterin cofactor-binding domain-containing protein [Armatimonadota bacterium]
MSASFNPEPERYELAADPLHRFALDRREFFKLVGGGIAVFLLLDGATAQESGGRRGGGGRALPQEIGAWLHIGEDGQVTVYTGKVEVGQNIRTSLAQAVAEELRAPAASIRLVMGDTRLTPFDMGTFGSRTTPDMAQRLRRVAAATRELLIDLAAEEWQAERATLTAAEGKVLQQGTGKSASFGALTKGRKLTKAVPGDVPVTPAAEWKTAGHSAPKVDGRDFVTGRHRYTTDLKPPGMLHGKVLRPASFGGTLASVDTKAAEALPGVIVVRDGDFVGVAAPTASEASRALKAIRAEWKPVPQISSRELFDAFRQEGRQARGNEARSPAGDASDIRLEQSYTVAYIAHAPLEPRAAVAQWEDGKLTVWTGTQRPFGVRSELANAFRIPEESVRVIVPDTG